MNQKKTYYLWNFFSEPQISRILFSMIINFDEKILIFWINQGSTRFNLFRKSRFWKISSRQILAIRCKRFVIGRMEIHHLSRILSFQGFSEKFSVFSRTSFSKWKVKQVTHKKRDLVSIYLFIKCQLLKRTFPKEKSRKNSSFKEFPGLVTTWLICLFPIRQGLSKQTVINLTKTVIHEP